MSASRRTLPDAPNRRGWCPSLARPMPTGDGLLARIHPPLGLLTVARLRAVADAADRFGNGHVDVTARANLQLRGVTEATRPGLVAALDAAGLGDTRGDGGPQRLTLTSSLAGLSPALLDARALAGAIEARGLSIAGLPPKTLVLIEGGGATDLRGIAADIHVRATTPGRAAVGLADGDGVAWATTLGESEIAEAVASLLRAFAATGRRRVRDLSGADRTALERAVSASAGPDARPSGSGVREHRCDEGGHAAAPPPSAREGGPRASRGREIGAPYPDTALPSPDPLGGPPSPAGGGGNRASAGDGLAHLDLAAPFGRCTAAMLARLAAVADALGTDDIRVSPGRGFVLPAGRCPADRLARHRGALAAAGFVTTPDDPRRAVAACPGAPACASGSTPTGADAARLAEAFRPFSARGMTAHVSGCAKGCAHPGAADLTLVGRDGRYGVVLGGPPGAAPALELTFEAALERVRRGDVETLALAFAPPSSGSELRAEPAFGNTI